MERRNELHTFANRPAAVQSHLFKSLLPAALVLCVTAAAAQANMEWIRQQWRGHNYREVIAPLKDFLDSLDDNSRDFEPDYMMATALANLTDHRSEGCRYFLAMVHLYNRRQRYPVAGSYVTIQSAMQETCPRELASLDPPPPQPGVSVSPIIMVIKRKDVLQQVRTPAAATAGNAGYYRLQLKHGGQYLDAKYCSNTITLNPASDWENGACQLWRLVPAAGGYYRLQLKHGGQYLDAKYCSNTIALNPGSDWENGACQLWRLTPAGDGYYRLQLKHGGQYLDASYCSSTIGLNPGSDWENGACQLWRLVPAR